MVNELSKIVEFEKWSVMLYGDYLYMMIDLKAMDRTFSFDRIRPLRSGFITPSIN